MCTFFHTKIHSIFLKRYQLFTIVLQHTKHEPKKNNIKSETPPFNICIQYIFHIIVGGKSSKDQRQSLGSGGLETHIKCERTLLSIPTMRKNVAF